MIISKNPHVLISLDRSANHPLFRNYSQLPLNNLPMYVLSFCDEHDNIIICTINDKNVDIVIPTLLLSIPSGLPFLSLMSLMIYILFKPLTNLN